MLGLSCTFLACVFDRPGWKLYIFETMSWAFGGLMLGHLLGLSCTFLACVFDRLDWELNHVMGLWWAYVGSLGGSAGPMFGLC